MPKDVCVSKGLVEMVTKDCAATKLPANITCELVEDRRMVDGNCPDQAGCPDGSRSDFSATGCQPPCKYVEKTTNKWEIRCSWAGTAQVTRPIACEQIRREGQDGWDFDGAGCIGSFSPNGAKQCNGTCFYATRTRANNCEPSPMTTACVVKGSVPLPTSCVDATGNPKLDCEE